MLLYPFQRGSQQPAGARFLHEGDQAKVGRVAARQKFQANVLREVLAFLHSSNLNEALHNGDVGQTAAGVSCLPIDVRRRKKFQTEP